jgi:hypothetical protein
LAGPSGVAVNPKTGHLAVVSYDSRVRSSTSRLKAPSAELASNGFFTGRFQNLSGVDFDRWGSMYVADVTKGKIWRMLPNHKFQVIAEYLPGPSDIGIDRVNHLILVPYQDSNAAEVNGLESPTAAIGRPHQAHAGGLRVRRAQEIRQGRIVLANEPMCLLQATQGQTFLSRPHRFDLQPMLRGTSTDENLLSS